MSGSALVACVGCTSSPGEGRLQEVTLRWHLVPTPGLTPSLITRQGDSVLMGGNGSSDGRIALLRVGAQGDSQSIALVPRSTYAPKAHWRSIAATDTAVLGIAGQAGGAHSITRWTVWRGGREEVAEHPQPVETFGGSHAGGLAAAGTAGTTSFIAGAWDGDGGRLDVAVWRPTGDDRWVRQVSRGTALASTATQQQQVASATAAPGGQAVLVGSMVDLAGEAVRQYAAVWTSSGSSPWAVLRLPGAAASASAQSVTCTDTQCWVAGSEDDDLALWRVVGSRANRVTLPSPAVPAAEKASLSANSGAVYLAVPGRGVLEKRTDRQWRLLDPPPRVSVTNVVVTDSTIYALGLHRGQVELWRAPLAGRDRS